jgi:hypothetical protein
VKFLTFLTIFHQEKNLGQTLLSSPCNISLFCLYPTDPRIIREVTSSELLTKQAMRKKFIYKKYILGLLLNIVTTELIHSYIGISFCKPVSKKSAACEHSYVLYCKTLKELHRAILNKRHGMPTSGVVFLHDDVLPHMNTAAHTQALLEHFNWELLDHLCHSPDLALSDYHLFTYLKNSMALQ